MVSVDIVFVGHHDFAPLCFATVGLLWTSPSPKYSCELARGLELIPCRTVLMILRFYGVNSQ